MSELSSACVENTRSDVIASCRRKNWRIGRSFRGAGVLGNSDKLRHVTEGTLRFSRKVTAAAIRRPRRTGPSPANPWLGELASRRTDPAERVCVMVWYCRGEGESDESPPMLSRVSTLLFSSPSMASDRLSMAQNFSSAERGTRRQSKKATADTTVDVRD